ncbi:zinc finger domain-containing protein [Kitasatospora griseola]
MTSALDVRCPYCNAARNTSCRTVNGTLRPVHVARKKAMQPKPAA